MPTQSPARCISKLCRLTDAHAKPEQRGTAVAIAAPILSRRSIQTAETRRVHGAIAPAPNNPDPAVADEYPRPLSIPQPPGVPGALRSGHQSSPGPQPKMPASGNTRTPLRAVHQLRSHLPSPATPASVPDACGTGDPAVAHRDAAYRVRRSATAQKLPSCDPPGRVLPGPR